MLYPRVEAWLPMARVNRAAGGALPTVPADAKGGDDRVALRIDWPDPAAPSACTVDDYQPVQAASALAGLASGNPAVQPEVTQGTMILQFAGSGVTMDGKPVSSDERAFARTEVAGLDDVPNERSSVMQDRRGAEASHGFHGTHAPSLVGERLTPDGDRWLKTLPVTVRPVITARRHPHIVNKLARVWDRPAALAAYMDELLISSRPGRRGFAMEVLEELVDLQRALQERRRI